MVRNERGTGAGSCIWIAARAAKQRGWSLAALGHPKWINPRPNSYKYGQPQTSVDVEPFVLGGSVITDHTLTLCFFYSSVMGTASVYCSQDLTAGL